MGKIATLYPPSDVDAIRVSRLLESRLAGIEGPAIVSDLSVSRAAPIYARWGAFWTPKAGGGTVTSVRGARILDTRTRPQHDVLERIPPFRYMHLHDPTGVWGGRFLPVELLSASQMGPVYLAVDIARRTACIVKVRREHMAYDRQGFDAAARLSREFEQLRWHGCSLSGPEPLGFYQRDGYVALVTSYIEGTPLLALPARDKRRHRARVALTRLVRRAHVAGVLLRDLSASNVLVAVDGSVRIVDFEFIGSRRDQDLDVVESPAWRQLSRVTSGSIRHSREFDLASVQLATEQLCACTSPMSVDAEPKDPA